jgi:hypothetical protein
LEKCRAGGGWQSANFLAVNLSSLITKDNRHRAIVMFAGDFLCLNRQAFLFLFGQCASGHNDESPVAPGRTDNRQVAIGKIIGADGLYEFAADLLRHAGILRRGHMRDIDNHKKNRENDRQSGEAGDEPEYYVRGALHESNMEVNLAMTDCFLNELTAGLPTQVILTFLFKWRKRFKIDKA